MRCEEIRKQFSAYIDGEALPEMAAAVEAHVADCPECQAELERYRNFAQAFSALGQEELPFGFDMELRARLAEEKARKPKKKQRRAWLGVAAVAACLLVVVGLGSAGLLSLFGGMGSAAKDSFTAQSAPMETEDYSEYFVAEETPMPAPSAANGAGNYTAIGDAVKQDALDVGAEERSADTEAVSRKIIKNYYMSLEVEDFDTAYQSISDLATQYGGYVVSAETYNYTWSTGGRIQIRVDAEQAEAVATIIAQLGDISDQNITTDDVTSEYYDAASRLSVYEAQRNRLLELYEKAETVEDMIVIEQALTGVIEQIESLEGTLQYLDQLTSLSLIEVSLSTPQKETVEVGGWAGFWQDMQNSLVRGLNNVVDFLSGLVLLLVRILPFLIILVLVVWGIVAICRHRRKKQK